MLDVFIESRINRHMLSPHSKSLLMLLLTLDANNKRNAGGIFPHHVLHEPYCKMNSLYNQGFVSLLKIFNDLLKLRLNPVALLFVTYKSPLFIRGDFWWGLSVLGKKVTKDAVS